MPASTWAKTGHRAVSAELGGGRWTWLCPRPGPSSAHSRPGSGRPTWEGGQVAGEGAGLALGPVPLLQLALQGVELAVAAVDEVLGSPFRLHLDDENLGQRPEGRTSEARGRGGGGSGLPGLEQGFSVVGRPVQGGVWGSIPGLHLLGASSVPTPRDNNKNAGGYRLAHAP